ncbi:unnamed protein product [Prunus brigantina]
MSHPADSPYWKLVDDKWPEFGKEPRNLRLALSSDGFNPHSSLSSRYSCWPVILVTYNLLPWLCMKRKFMMLTLLISGPKQPGNDIDVYLEPLIDDLKSLWDGIRGVQRAAFNGKPEYGTPPEPLNGEEVLHIVEDINYIWGSKNGGSVGENDGDRVCWKKKSKFFDLEYWKYLHMRHVLNVMHIEKNVCNSIIGTLLEIPGKNKDGIATRLDLLNMWVKIDLWMYPFERYMKVLKGYVQNRTRPEGCIAKQYIAEEAVEFCTKHLSEVNTVGVPSS